MVTRGRGRWLLVVASMALLATGCKAHPADTWSPEAIDARTQINALLDAAEVAERAGDDDAASEARAEAAAIEARVFQASPPVGATTVRHDPTLAGGFFDAPWRRTPAGAPTARSTSRLPGPRPPTRWPTSCSAAGGRHLRVRDQQRHLLPGDR